VKTDRDLNGAILKIDIIQFLKTKQTLGLRMAILGFFIAAFGFTVGYFGLIRLGVAISICGWMLAVAGLIYYFFERRS